MSIYDEHPEGPPEIRLPQTIRVMCGIRREPMAEFVSHYKTLTRVLWYSYHPVQGIYNYEYAHTNIGTVWAFPGYRCEHCKTTFFGSEWSDFVHDCVQEKSLRRAA